MRIPIYQVDAFADRVFAGNPAAVCPLEQWLPDELMQSIAAENNLAETAFLVREGDGWGLRWFTPAVEVDLCGHATLAAAFVILRSIDPDRHRVLFRTEKAGTLTVTREGERLALELPARPARACETPAGLAAALGSAPREVLAARDYLAVYDDADLVAGLRPDFRALGRLDRSVIATAPGSGGIDFVSRFFAPLFGIDEDPVTGSAHCTLIPFWAERLGTNAMTARQISSRGGTLHCHLRDDRVGVAGQAVLYLEGTIEV